MATFELISLSEYRDKPALRPLLAEAQKYIWDANMYLALGKDSGYIHGERCYKKLMPLLKKLEERNF